MRPPYSSLHHPHPHPVPSPALASVRVEKMLLGTSVLHGKCSASPTCSHWLVGTLIFCLPLVSPARKALSGFRQTDSAPGGSCQEDTRQKVMGQREKTGGPHGEMRTHVPTTGRRGTVAGILTSRPAPSSGLWGSGTELGTTCFLRSRPSPWLPASLTFPRLVVLQEDPLEVAQTLAR